MIHMIEYLRNFREDEPAWIGRYLRGEQIVFKDIMSSRVAYYPGSGYDGTLLKVSNMSHSVHSFLYVDYGISRKELENHLAQKNSIRGYHPIGRIEWEESDLLPNGQFPMNINMKPMFFEPTTFVDPNEKPYCFSLIMERDEDQDDSRGAEHFVITFLFADGIATYYQLFVKEYSKAPWIFLLQDHGFGCNYDRFGRGGILDTIIKKSKAYPTFVICGDNTRIWNCYKKVHEALPVYGGMHHNRRDLFKLGITNSLI